MPAHLFRPAFLSSKQRRMNRLTINLVLAFVASLICPPRSFGEISFTGFSNAVGLNFAANASQLGSVARISPAQHYSGGAIWFQDPQPLTFGFTTDFDFRISGAAGNGDGSGQVGGDGFAFVIQDIGNTAIGAIAGELGYANIPRSIAIEFDTFRNSWDRSTNDVAIHSRGQLPNSNRREGQLSIASVPGNFADGAVHRARVNYRPGVLSVYVDDFTRPVTSLSIDNLPQYLGLDDGAAWAGFTASTGGDVENHDLLNWSFLSCEEALKGSLSVPESFTPVAGLPPVSAPLENGIMAVRFDPKGGAEAAKRACGVERFNFVNSITSDPSHFIPYLVTAPLGFTGDAKTLPPIFLIDGMPDILEEGFEVVRAQYPLIDPPLDKANGQQTYLAYLVHGTPTNTIPEGTHRMLPINRGQYSDASETYYPLHYDVPDDPSQIAFLDNPGNQKGFVSPGVDFTAFETRLVGITADGEIVHWDKIGTNWTWKAFSLEDETTVTIDDPGFRQSLELRDLQLGIRDVRFDIVPEPHSIVILVGAITCLAGRYWVCRNLGL